MKFKVPLVLESLTTTPPLPPVGFESFYLKNGDLYTLDSSGNETLVSSISGGSWDNVVFVNDINTDLPAPSGGVITLATNTTYYFNQGTHTFGTTRMVVQNGTNIMGFGKTNTILSYSGTSTFITGTNVNCVIRDVEFLNTSNGTCFNISNTSVFSIYFENINFRSWNRVGESGGGGFFAKWCLIVNCVSSGFTFSSVNLGSVIIDVCSFRQFTSGLAGAYAIKFNNGSVATSFRCYSGIFDSQLNHWGIWVDGTITVNAGAILRGNVFSGGNVVADRLKGVNGNTPNWTVMYGENHGIAGLQFVDVEIISTADASLGNSAGTYVEGTTVRGYIMPLSQYDQYATVMQAQVTALMTNAAGTNVRLGLRNLTDGINDAGSLGAADEGTLIPLYSEWVNITPNKNCNAYYTKAVGSSTRYALKIRIKTF